MALASFSKVALRGLSLFSICERAGWLTPALAASSLGVFPIIDDKVLKLADRTETQSLKLWLFGLVQGAPTRRGEKGLKGFFSGLVNAVGCVMIIPRHGEPNMNEIILSRWCYKNGDHLKGFPLFE
jgi:hypothetical protein